MMAMKAGPLSRKSTCMLIASAFLGGWAAHGVYAKNGAASGSSIEAYVLNAPIAIAENAMEFGQNAAIWANNIAETALYVAELVQKIL